MATQQLFRPNGEHVADVVTTQAAPDVIIWGSRFFVLNNGRYLETEKVERIASWGPPRAAGAAYSTRG